MSKNKKIFLVVAVLFTATMIFFTINIFSLTTRPGAKKHLIETIKPKEAPHPTADSIARDSSQAK
ncbi:MAG: hypothetical protein V4714_07775 [Bacteroidota bacterium]